MVEKIELDTVKEKYKGAQARNYERTRTTHSTWQKENEIVTDYLNFLQETGEVNSVIDVPVRTGRFFPIYQKLDIYTVGLDISSDMLQQAKIKSENLGFLVALQEEDIVDGSPEFTADLVVCTRFMNWINFENFQKALTNITLMADKYIVLELGYLLEGEVNDSRTHRYQLNDIMETFDKLDITVEDKKRVTDESSDKRVFIYLLSVGGDDSENETTTTTKSWDNYFGV